jgi:hypothetical protein
MSTIVHLPNAQHSANDKPEPAQIICSACGATADAACACGAPYLPAGERAADAVAKNPGMSDREIGAAIGTSHQTVGRARRKLTGPHGPVAKRVGRDGKARKLPAERPLGLNGPLSKKELETLRLLPEDPSTWGVEVVDKAGKRWRNDVRFSSKAEAEAYGDTCARDEVADYVTAKVIQRSDEFNGCYMVRRRKGGPLHFSYPDGSCCTKLQVWRIEDEADNASPTLGLSAEAEEDRKVEQHAGEDQNSEEKRDGEHVDAVSAESMTPEEESALYLDWFIGSIKSACLWLSKIAAEADRQKARQFVIDWAGDKQIGELLEQLGPNRFFAAIPFAPKLKGEIERRCHDPRAAHRICSAKAKASIATPTPKVSRWRDMELDELQALILTEQRRSVDQHFAPQEWQRLDKMRARAKELTAKTAGNGEAYGKPVLNTGAP